MGYDLCRFTQSVNSHLLCSLCHQIISNGVESIKCRHIYCDQCLKSWLQLNSYCPVESLPLFYRDVSPISQSLRNMLFKLEIKCDFESEGCKEIVTLNGLEDHVKRCEFNTSLKVKCNLGCGLEMTKKEYCTHDCVGELLSLVNAQQKRIKFLEHLVSEIKEKNGWRITNGLVFAGNDTIECQSYRAQLAQHCNPLDFYSVFVAKIINLGEDSSNIRVGLFDPYFLGEKCVPSEENSVINFRSNGSIHSKHDMSTALVSEDWRNGDTIICGIKLADQSRKRSLNEKHVVVYFKRNNKLVAEKLIKCSTEQLYPAVYIWSNGAHIETKLLIGAMRVPKEEPVFMKKSKIKREGK